MLKFWERYLWGQKASRQDVEALPIVFELDTKFGFEGEVTEVKLKEIVVDAKKIMKEEENSLIIFKSRNERWSDKEVSGQERISTNNFGNVTECML